MLVIRLRRVGRKHDPHYRIVVAEHTAPVQGKFIAEIGHHHPKSKETVVQKEAFLSWLDKGAKPSNTVAKLAERQGITHKHVVVIMEQGKPKAKAQERAEAKNKTLETPKEEPSDSTETSEAEAAAENTEEVNTEAESTDTETPSEEEKTE